MDVAFLAVMLFASCRFWGYEAILGGLLYGFLGVDDVATLECKALLDRV